MLFLPRFHFGTGVVKLRTGGFAPANGTLFPSALVLIWAFGCSLPGFSAIEPRADDVPVGDVPGRSGHHDVSHEARHAAYFFPIHLLGNLLRMAAGDFYPGGSDVCGEPSVPAIQ